MRVCDRIIGFGRRIRSRPWNGGSIAPESIGDGTELRVFEGIRVLFLEGQTGSGMAGQVS